MREVNSCLHEANTPHKCTKSCGSNLLTTCLFTSTFRRVEVGIESGREEIEGEDAISGPEIEGRFEGCGKADGEAIAGADSARWSDGFRASGMVYPSASTCALSTHQAVFCSPLVAPMLWLQPPSGPARFFEKGTDGIS